MATDTANRNVIIERNALGTLTVTNMRGGQLRIGGAETDFSPIELLLAGIGGCTGLDVDALTSRRAEPDRFGMRVDANKVRDESGNRLTDIVVTFRVAFPAGAGGDAARELLPEAVRTSHDRLCTVSRTVELGTQIDTKIVEE